MVLRNVIPALIAAIMLVVAPLANAADGVFMVVKGDIKVETADKKITPAKVGMKISPGSAVIAGKDARAKIVMTDNNVLNISPESKMVIEKYENTGDKKNVSLNLLYGKVRSTVNQKYEGENKFNMKTPSAVAGVRGTDFMTGFTPSTKVSQIVTFEGKVEVGSGIGSNGQIMNPVAVSAGQMTVASAGGAPAPPTSVPANMLASMNQDSKSDDKNDRAPAAAGNDGGGKKDKEEGAKKEDGPKKEDGAKKEDGGKGDNNAKNDGGPGNGKDGDNNAKNDGPNGKGNDGGPGGPGEGGDRGPASVGGPGGDGPSNDFAPELPGGPDGGFVAVDGPGGGLGDTGMFLPPPEMGCAMCGPIGPVLDPGLIQNTRTQLLIHIQY